MAPLADTSGDLCRPGPEIVQRKVGNASKTVYQWTHKKMVVFLGLSHPFLGIFVGGMIWF